MFSFLSIRGRASPLCKYFACYRHLSKQLDPASSGSCRHETYPSRSYSTSVRMPSLSPTMSEGTIVKWYKAEGDSVQPGDVLCDIQTDKAVVSFEFDDEGVLARVLRSDGASGTVGDVIAVMADPGEDWKAVSAEAANLATSATPTVESKPSPPPPPVPPPITPASPTPPPQSASTSPARRVGPAAQLLLRLHRLKPGDLRATGPHGTLLKSDVVAYVNSAPAKPPSPSVASAASLPPAAVAPAAAASPTASRPSMSVLEPRTPPGYLDHPVAPGLRDWAALQTALKSGVPHAYATAACRPCSVPVLGGIADGQAMAALAVRALASAMSASGDPVNVGVLLLAAPALPRLVRLPRAQAMGLREIGRRLAAAQADSASQPANDSGPLGAVVCDLSSQPAVQSAHLVLHPDAPILLTVGRPSDSVSEADQQPEPLVRLGLTVDSRRLDHAEAASLLGSVAAGMENPLLALSGPTVSANSESATAASLMSPGIVGSDLLQLGLDD